MLTVSVKDKNVFDDKTQTFNTVKGGILHLEYSLLTVSKWEAQWHIPFFNGEPKTAEQALSFLKCMIVDRTYSEEMINLLSEEEMEEINAYIDNPSTATTITDIREGTRFGNPRQEIYTSEVIYWMMIQYGIPFECEKWNIKNLFMLLKVCAIKANKENKMSGSELAKYNTQLNRARRGL